MKVEITAPDFAAIMRGVEGDIARAASTAMRETTSDAKQELREQIMASGLGPRLANTWRGDVYPKSGASMNPAGYIYSAAPDIVDSFVRGAQIVPIKGSRYLAIPTDKVPRAPGSGRASSTKKMTPAQVETSFNQDLIIRPGRNGHLLAFVDPNLFRGRRLKGVRRGGKPQLVLMFTLVRTLRMPKLLDLEGPAERWSQAFAAAFAQDRGA